MERRDFLTAACALSVASTLGSADTANAAGSAGKVMLRVATLAPKGSSWMRVFSAWNNTLQQRTQGKLGLHFYPGGAAGDERDVVRKMRAGQLDAAAVTTVGLGQIVRSVLVLQAPGVCHSYRQIDAVRSKLAGEFEHDFDRAGFKLLGWGDAGQGRLFSNRPIHTPADLRQARIWRWRDDPTWQAVLNAAGANGVALGLPEVYPALRTNRIDAFPGTAIAAVAFQWYTKASYVTREPRAIVVGALVIKKERYAALPEPLKRALIETGNTANRALAQAVRRDDEKAFSAIVQRGVKPVNRSKASKEWDDVLRKARRSLVGKLYSADLLNRVERIAASAG